jgi:tRNA modification GTPase
MAGYTVHFGEIIDEDGAVVDDALVIVYHSPRSYTGEDSTEIMCHGSSYIVQRIIELLMNLGCRMARPGEFTERAFMNGKMDLSQAEAVADLIAASNAASHRLAMSQMRGGFSKELGHLRSQLLEMTTLLELEIDFSEEDVEFADRKELSDLAHTIKTTIEHLIDSFRTGNAIKNGVPVAIIGPTNVGKSTLLNRLLHDDKAIVSDIHGTTRDIIEDTITIDGRLFRFIDTAGIRHTDDTIENLGIERSLKAAERARIILLMRDDEHDYPELPIANDQSPMANDQSPMANSPVVIRIHNKSSHFQALNGIGIPELKQKLVYSAPADEDAVVVNQRHKESLTLALSDIQRAMTALEADISGDLVSEDLRLCIQHLAEILGGDGAITTPEVLENIFKHFCVGK